MQIQNILAQSPHEASVASPRVRSLGQLTMGAAWRLDLQHARASHLFLWITRGQGRATILGKRRGVGAHNALYVPAGSLMSLDLGKQCYGIAVDLPAHETGIWPETPRHLRIRDVMAQNEVTAILDNMQREQSTHRAFGDEAARAHAGLLAVWMRRMLALPDNQPAPRIPAAERLTAAFCALVERDYRSGKPMADYAAALGVTPTHLSRACRQVAGLTAADMITQRVLYAARDMLESGDLPIRLIAEMLGFSSAAYFTRFIQNQTGRTPSALRQAARG
ncbi:transcriptional regulator, AraC family protein [Pseudooceanicola batsensis HTCC2597]|uniref:Transcriptional regulator, AraC family protein n=1 Tax=Pseudooceanicola batsensis (strain ATCC BAA-863 / DSM 15984 / KCTC 12145 / HTCC2597) TaxID=252305 RepID=A3TWU3_PSEBH|nr:AraC family transcriptional regulator [Pseudooceanicola batsensis]EAQ03303.1 transcriptional regulator, AraC family protein [Pseudooceanicola batsensis HTCC2597]